MYQSLMLSEAHVLDEEAVPEQDLVVHRRDELDRLLQALSPAETGPSDLCYLLGPTGTGKTMLAKLVLDRLENDETMPTVDTAYVNCWNHHERTDILFQVVDAMRDAPIHRRSTGRSELLDYLHDEPGHPEYVILDEADQLSDKRILYDLHETSNLNVVLVANNEDALFAEIDDRLRSRLAVGRRIECGSYSAQQLSAILQKRTEFVLGSPGRRYSRQQLDAIAANADGDARVAIRALRVAIEAGASKRLADEEIERALPEARDQLRQKSRDQLRDHQLKVLEVVEDQDGPLTSTEIAKRYRERVGDEDARTKRTVRTYLTKLEQYNHIEKIEVKGRPKYVPAAVETE